MLRNRNSKPPEVMTWGKAMPVISVCAVFDALRTFFTLFWFFGPLLAGAAVASTSGGGWLGGVFGGGTTAVVAYAGGAALTVFGIIMAMAIGLLGWLTTGLWLILSNPRIFIRNIGSFLKMMFSLFISELPFLGALPALTASTWSLYHTQIKKERKELSAWKISQATQAQQERTQQLMALAQMRKDQEQQEIEMEEQERSDLEVEGAEQSEADSEEGDNGQSEEAGGHVGESGEGNYEGSPHRHRSGDRGASRQQEESGYQGRYSERAAGQQHGSDRSRGGDGQQDASGQPGGVGAGANGLGNENEGDDVDMQPNDALSELNAKQNLTKEESALLSRAREIMIKRSIGTTDTDPVLRAAYNRSQNGQEVFDGTYKTRNGFKFSNVHYR